eukprot:COSAG02_NODE_55122_length_292_cov_0.808290_1_plen_60_part_01
MGMGDLFQLYLVRFCLSVSASLSLSVCVRRARVCVRVFLSGGLADWLAGRVAVCLDGCES